MFRTQYQRTPVFTNPGSKVKKTYKMKIDKFGKKYLECTGEDDLDGFIQSFHDSTEVHKLIERYNMIGDATIFNKAQTSFGDFTAMPENLADVYAKVVEATEFFKELPVELKREFNHSPSEFYSSIGTDKYYSVLSRLNPESSPVQQSEVISDEQKQ